MPLIHMVAEPPPSRLTALTAPSAFSSLPSWYSVSPFDPDERPSTTIRMMPPVAVIPTAVRGFLRHRSSLQVGEYWITPFSRMSALPLRTSTAPGVPSAHPTWTLEPTFSDLIHVAPLPTSFELNTTVLVLVTARGVDVLHRTASTV